MVLIMVKEIECPFCAKGIGKKVGKSDWLVCNVCKEVFQAQTNPNFGEDKDE